MIRTLCLSLLLLLGLFRVAAADADQPGAGNVPTPGLVTQAAPPAPPDAATQAHRLAMATLLGERQAYSAGFDWNASGDRVALKRQFGAQMRAFDLRELELRRDWYQALGQSELLARIQARIERLTQPRPALPELEASESAPPVSPDLEPEVIQ
ncbi:MAG: hypothetical protein WC326_04605 [Candidatus Delongbacteria bacterium]